MNDQNICLSSHLDSFGQIVEIWVADQIAEKTNLVFDYLHYWRKRRHHDEHFRPPHSSQMQRRSWPNRLAHYDDIIFFYGLKLAQRKIIHVFCITQPILAVWHHLIPIIVLDIDPIALILNDEHMHMQQMLNIADEIDYFGHVFAVCMKEYQ